MKILIIFKNMKNQKVILHYYLESFSISLPKTFPELNEGIRQMLKISKEEFQNLKIKVLLGGTNAKLKLDLNESMYNECITGKKEMHEIFIENKEKIYNEILNKIKPTIDNLKIKCNNLERELNDLKKEYCDYKNQKEKEKEELLKIIKNGDLKNKSKIIINKSIKESSLIVNDEYPSELASNIIYEEKKENEDDEDLNETKENEKSTNNKMSNISHNQLKESSFSLFGESENNEKQLNEIKIQGSINSDNNNNKNKDEIKNNKSGSLLSDFYNDYFN